MEKKPILIRTQLISFIIISVMLAVSPLAWGKDAVFEDLFVRSGVWYDKITEKIFSGKMKGSMEGISRGCRGCKTYEGQLQDGKAEGEWSYFHDNGQVYQRKNFRQGRLDGDFVSFYYDGSLCQKSVYENGKLLGALERYHRNGEIWSVEDRSPECDMCLCGDKKHQD
tara:strand:+ start:44 stop:547 length:504 start_codon:yes stop_codon:yes gene_type:complete